MRNQYSLEVPLYASDYFAQPINFIVRALLSRDLLGPRLTHKPEGYIDCGPWILQLRPELLVKSIFPI